ncbi:MAG TPA: DEAD/DEAH box helicase, partial [Microbacterium sp.]|nr:DEAD/DEAH box helicase [Microbacterium sp.]
MPKSRKPAGSRAQNFEPRYGKKPYRAPSGSAAKPGSKSPKHRGYRAEETDAAPKRRWSAQEKAGRDAARGIRTHASRDHDDRRDPRPPSQKSGRAGDTPRGDRRDTARRGSDPTFGTRSDRPRRDERPGRSFDDRPRRSFDDRPGRSFDDRPRRSYDDRPRRSYEDRPARDDRPRRSFDDRPRRSYDDRPARDDRPRRSYDDRPRRSYEDRPRREQAPVAHAPHLDQVHEKLQAEAVQAEEVADVTFASLGLGENIVRVLADLGAETPFPIQAATIGPILEGKDVLARGRTGSGKTIAFGAPLVESILRAQAGQRRAFGRSPKALILAPTRELALQLDRTVQPIARSVGLFTTQIYGGVPQARQVGALKKGVDIVIGTPGRIEDLHEQGKLDLSEVRIVVLDEADHMSELGFLEPMQRILRLVSEGAQKLMFSATLDREVAALVDEFLVDPAVYEVAGEDQDSGTIDHRVLVIDHRDKAEILASLVAREGKTLVFSRTRAYAEMLAEQFDDAGIRAVALHGDLNQAKRTRNLERLTSGRVDVL